MMRLPQFVAILGLGLAASAALTDARAQENADGAQPSFDCAKASAPIEHAICADPALARLDAELAARYTEALAKTADADALRATQRAWADERAAACGILPGADDDVPNFDDTHFSCLKDLYTSRIAEIGKAPEAAATGDPARIIDGTWQLANVIDAADKSLMETGQEGRLFRLDRHALSTLGGKGCSGPTLEPLASARTRPLDDEEQAMIAKADANAADTADGVAGFCLGRLFALYLPGKDGSLLVADGGAVYRLERLSAKLP